MYIRLTKVSFTFVLVLFFTSLFFTTGAYADPPSRIARLSYIDGPVSFSPAGDTSVWVSARINRPLIIGDRLWIDNHARAEVQLSNAALRVYHQTSFRVLNLNDHLAQFELLQGSLTLFVRRLSAGQSYEIDTPNLAFKVTRPGEYRFDVTDSTTTVTVRRGKGIAYAKHVAYKISGPASYRFTGQTLNHQYIVLPALDVYDRWSLTRERHVTSSRSMRYVSSTMIGYEDLDTYGSWRYVKEYGNVWTPTNVYSGWAPYRDGHWSWVYPWGWTWIDDQPWGFAPSHYGRWANYNHTWVWIPGRRNVQPTYAPALVVFIGGLQLSINSGPNIGWFPLGPRDVYIPPYQVSQEYFTKVNVTNTTINQVQITNVYNNPTSPMQYSNHQVPNAVTAVPNTAFVQSESAAKTAVSVSEAAIIAAPVSTTAAVAPDEKSVAGGQAASTIAKPPESAIDKVPVVLTPPPAPVAPFAEQEPKLSDNAGKPLDKQEMDSLKPAEKMPVVEVNPPSEASIPEATPEKTTTDKDKSKQDKELIDKTASDQAAADKAQAEAEADKATAVKASTDQAADKTPADQSEANKAASAQAEIDKITADKVASDQAAADKAATDKANAERAAANAQAEADKANAAQAAKDEANKVATENAAAERAAANAKAESDRASAAQAAKDEANKVATENAAAAERAVANAKEEADRASAAQAAKEEANITATENAAAERAAANAKAEAERASAAQAAQAEANRAATEKAQAERAAANAQAEADRATAANAEANHAAQQAKEEAQKAAAEKADADSEAAAKAAAVEAVTP